MSAPVIFSISEGSIPLLIVRQSADGLAGEVVISTPSVTMTIRIPEIAHAFNGVAPEHEAHGPWSAVGVV